MDSNEIYWYLVEELGYSRDEANRLAPLVANELADYSFEYDQHRIDEIAKGL